MKFTKYFLASFLMLAVFLAGFITGRTTTEYHSDAAEKLIQMPAMLTGVHTLPATGTIELAFSPGGGITQMIIDEIDQARQSVFVMAYEFTNMDIADALIHAKSRGVDVRVILDKSQLKEKESKSCLFYIADNGIPVNTDSSFHMAHNNVMIIDDTDVVTGSFNFTQSAELSNGENGEIHQGNKALAEEFTKYWQWRWKSTSPYTK